MSQPVCASPADLINLGRYPLLNLESAEGQKVIREGQQQLREVGCCAMPAFLRVEMIAAMAEEARSLAGLAYHSTVVGNAYLEPEDPSLPLDHPNRLKDTTALGAVAYDQIPEPSFIRQLYEWQPLVDFLAALLEKPKLYRYADPMGGLNLAVMNDQDYLRWHFDQTDFVTSLALQNSEAGGDFEFVPRIRGKGDEQFEKVRAILKGSTEGVVRLPMEPGTLILFEGRYSLHRVTPIEGKRSRLVALLGYDEKPNVTSTEHLQYMRYGRVAKPQAIAPSP